MEKKHSTWQKIWVTGFMILCYKKGLTAHEAVDILRSRGIDINPRFGTPNHPARADDISRIIGRPNEELDQAKQDIQDKMDELLKQLKGN